MEAAAIGLDFGFREFQDCSRPVSRLNEAETLPTLQERGVGSATCVLGGHIWSRTCPACGFFPRTFTCG